MKIDSYHHGQLFWPLFPIDVQHIMHGFLLEGHVYSTEPATAYIAQSLVNQEFHLQNLINACMPMILSIKFMYQNNEI